MVLLLASNFRVLEKPQYFMSCCWRIPAIRRRQWVQVVLPSGPIHPFISSGPFSPHDIQIFGYLSGRRCSKWHCFLVPNFLCPRSRNTSQAKLSLLLGQKVIHCVAVVAGRHKIARGWWSAVEGEILIYTASRLTVFAAPVVCLYLDFAALLSERRAPLSRKGRFSHKSSACGFKCFGLCTRFYPGTPTSCCRNACWPSCLTGTAHPQRPVERAPEVGHYTNGTFCMYGLFV